MTSGYRATRHLFTARDGTAIHGWVWSPRGGTATRLLVDAGNGSSEFPATPAGPDACYRDAIVEQGWSVLTLRERSAQSPPNGGSVNARLEASAADYLTAVDTLVSDTRVDPMAVAFAGCGVGATVARAICDRQPRFGPAWSIDPAGVIASAGESVDERTVTCHDAVAAADTDHYGERLVAWATTHRATAPTTPVSLTVVLRQVAAYNAGRLESFLNAYTDSAVVEERGGATVAVGRRELRSMYEPRLRPPRDRVDVSVGRLTGDTVALYENVERADGVRYSMCVEYSILNELISRVTYSRCDSCSYGAGNIRCR